MATTSAIITSVSPANKTASKAITDINPEAGNGAIKALCTALNGLTDNTLSDIQRVDKTDITAATTKPAPTLTWTTPDGTNEVEASIIENEIRNNGFYGARVTVANDPFKNNAKFYTLNQCSFAIYACSAYFRKDLHCLYIDVYKSASNTAHFTELVAGDKFLIKLDETDTTAATTIELKIIEDAS